MFIEVKIVLFEPVPAFVVSDKSSVDSMFHVQSGWYGVIYTLSWRTLRLIGKLPSSGVLPGKGAGAPPSPWCGRRPGPRPGCLGEPGKGTGEPLGVGRAPLLKGNGVGEPDGLGVGAEEPVMVRVKGLLFCFQLVYDMGCEGIQGPRRT